MISEVYNIDCMEYMRRLPDKHFDLAIADPPYGDGLCVDNQQITPPIHKQWNRFGQRFDRYKSTHSEQAEHGQRSSAKKSLRGTPHRPASFFQNSSVSHASKLFGAETILHCHRADALLYGAN